MPGSRRKLPKIEASTVTMSTMPRLPLPTILAAAAILALCGCDRQSVDRPDPPAALSAPAETAAPKNDIVPLVIEGEGLRLFNPATSAATPIPFGRPQGDVLALLQRLRGPARIGTNEDCGAGPVEFATWPDGLSLAFQRNRFVGWGVGQRASGRYATASGIGPGSTRVELDAAYAGISIIKSSLGIEFAAGGFFGLISGTDRSSKITDMWAGTSCAAR